MRRYLLDPRFYAFASVNLALIGAAIYKVAWYVSDQMGHDAR